MIVFWSLVIIISAVFHLRAEHNKNQAQIYRFKPLTIILIILLALFSQNPPTNFYKAAVITGLIFSLAGDIFLMLPGDKFLPGLTSFLTAHLCYIAAFTNPAGFYDNWFTLLPFLLLGTAVYIYLLPTLNKMRTPTAIYILAITLMAWQAFGHWQQTATTNALFAFAGTLLFLISDGTLAINRFRHPFPSAQPIIMSTYFTAQYLIALSI